MKKMLVILMILALALAMLTASGCEIIDMFRSGTNTIVTTTTKDDGTVVTTTETYTDGGLYVSKQVEANKAQKPIMLMEAADDEKLEIKGLKRWEIYASTGPPQLKQYISAMERVFINGISLVAMVAQGYINADATVKIVNAVGALKNGTNTYQITTQDGGPVQISQSGQIQNGSVTVNKTQQENMNNAVPVTESPATQ